MTIDYGVGVNVRDGGRAHSLPVFNKVRSTWLRMYPAPKEPEESICSVIFRCVLSQLGLCTFLVLWTMSWVFIIHSFEGPYETKIAWEFEKEQNQLIIDLATELRQITPLSPKWRKAIETRIESERELTIKAVGQGARLHPGQFWNVPGTFLFTICAMTALGFGAPVPQTVWGRTTALIYAGVAVPTHIILMMNASNCVIAHLEVCYQRLKNCCAEKNPIRNDVFSTNDSPNCSRNLEQLKTSHARLQRKLKCCLHIFTVGRGIPLAGIIYYICGATLFGVARSKPALETFMFPLDFTTSGGLEHIEGHWRVLYGLYVEGAMCLLAITIATLQRHSSDTMSNLSQKYRLFATEL